MQRKINPAYFSFIKQSYISSAYYYEGLKIMGRERELAVRD